MKTLCAQSGFKRSRPTMLGLKGILYILIATKYIVLGGGEEVPIRVNGLIKQFILLSLPEDPSRSVEQIFWIFQTNIIASYMNSQLKVMKNDFKGRLEMLDNGGTLRIGQLRLEDSGLYTGTISFTDGTVHTTSYNLTLYEPVPAPEIKITVMKIGDLCNVTLRCSVSKNTSTLSYTWKYRHGNSDYQQYNNYGDTIQMSLKNDSWDTEVMCIVQNPADQKNVSLQNICVDYNMKGRGPGGTQNRGYYALLCVPLLLLVFLGWYWCEMKKKRRKELKTSIPEEIQYAELRMAPSNISNQVPKKDYNPPVEPSEGIMYSTLRHDTD
ncbi:SLAM family member 9-like [Mantella aurantiaca]